MSNKVAPLPDAKYLQNSLTVVVRNEATAAAPAKTATRSGQATCNLIVEFAFDIGVTLVDLIMDILVTQSFMIATNPEYNFYGYLQLSLLVFCQLWKGYSTIMNDRSNPITDSRAFRALSSREKTFFFLTVLLAFTPFGIMREWYVVKLTPAKFDADRYNMGPKLQLENTKLSNIITGTIPGALIQLHAYLAIMFDDRSDLSSAALQNTLFLSRISLMIATVMAGFSIARTNIKTEKSWSSFWSRFPLYGYLPKQLLGIVVMAVGQALVSMAYFSLFVIGFIFPSLAVAYFYGNTVTSKLNGMLVSLLLVCLEFSIFVGYKIWIGEMWHPGPAVDSTWTKDHINGFFDKIPQFLGSTALWRLPNRDPRRVAPHLFFWCFIYKIVMNNLLIFLGIYQIYLPSWRANHSSISDGQTSREQELLWIVIIMDASLLVGYILIMLSMNPDHDKRWFLGKKFNGKELYLKIFLLREKEKSYTKFQNKDEERAFCIRTRHPIWLPPIVMEEWICEDLYERYMAMGSAGELPECPKFIKTSTQMTRFETRMKHVLEYHKREERLNLIMGKLKEIKANCKEEPKEPNKTLTKKASLKRKSSLKSLTRGFTLRSIKTIFSKRSKPEDEQQTVNEDVATWNRIMDQTKTARISEPELKELWDRFDKDKNGYIDLEELNLMFNALVDAFLIALGPVDGAADLSRELRAAVPSMAKENLEKLSTAKSGEVSWEEFKSTGVSFTFEQKAAEIIADFHSGAIPP